MNSLTRRDSSIYWLMPIFLGILSRLIFFNVSLLEILSLAWLLLGKGYKDLPFLLRTSFCRLGYLYLSAAALLVSDIFNSSEFDSLIKGFSAYTIFPITCLFLVRNFSLSQIWIVNILNILLTLFSKVLSEGLVFSQDSFKFGFSIPIVFILLTGSLLISPYIRRYPSLNFLSPILLFSIVSFLGIWSNLRLLAFVAFLSVLIFFSCYSLSSIRISQKFISISFLALLLPPFLILISLSLSYLASFILQILPSSVIHPNAVAKTLTQIDGDLGILFAGRHEIFSSIAAWLDKPILGWGSWAMDPNLTYDLTGKEIMVALNYTFDISRYVDIMSDSSSNIVGLIPTHSFILNLLVWSGFLGFIPSYLFVCSFLQSLLLTVNCSAYSLNTFVFIFVSNLSIWNLLFSPFGFSNRISLSLSIAVSIAWFTKLRLYQKNVLTLHS